MPETDALPLSGPLYDVEEQAAMPEVASVPTKLNETGLLYQPFASGCRLGTPRTAGGVESYENPTAALPTFPALSVHVPDTDAFPLSGPL
ncbi:MAG TPA: hypothetical protein VKB73_04725 [Gaiellaceae bacterium]|nr:hypothetical protein [Gaiellaceae bacterium]